MPERSAITNVCFADYLRTRGINRLDGLILSHGDAGHLGGASEVCSTTSVAIHVSTRVHEIVPDSIALSSPNYKATRSNARCSRPGNEWRLSRKRGDAGAISAKRFRGENR